MTLAEVVIDQGFPLSRLNQTKPAIWVRFLIWAKNPRGTGRYRMATRRREGPPGLPHLRADYTAKSTLGTQTCPAVQLIEGSGGGPVCYSQCGWLRLPAHTYPAPEASHPLSP